MKWQLVCHFCVLQKKFLLTFLSFLYVYIYSFFRCFPSQIAFFYTRCIVVPRPIDRCSLDSFYVQRQSFPLTKMFLNSPHPSSSSSLVSDHKKLKEYCLIIQQLNKRAEGSASLMGMYQRVFCKSLWVMVPCVPWVTISTTCTMSLWRNYVKCKHIFMFS